MDEYPLMPDLKDLLPAEFFKTPQFNTAITHQSAGFPNNERMEFLGDAVLQLAISETLYLSSAKDEGYLTKFRAYLVCKDTLSELAQECRLGDLIKLGPGENRDNITKSILGNAFEAIIAAVYLAHGWDTVRGFIETVYASRLEHMPTLEKLKDAKTRLQEYLQSLGHALPVYALTKSGPGNAPVFEARCSIDELDVVTRGRGATRRAAEQEAAVRALELLQAGLS